LSDLNINSNKLETEIMEIRDFRETFTSEKESIEK